MHEGSITSQIVENVLREAEKRNAKKVVEVNLAIGKLMFLNLDQVRFWYEQLTKNTILENSRLVIEEKEGYVRCGKCGYEGKLNVIDDPMFHVPMPTLNCPKCGGTVKIVSGRDCVIKSVRMLV